MGIAVTPEQGELAEAVRGWIARAVPPEEVRKLLDVPGGGRPPFWDALAAQGLLAVHLPEAYGGGGGGLVDLAVVVEEAARAALPGPFVANVLASAVLAAEPAAEPGLSVLSGDSVRSSGRADLVRALGCGERIGAVAFGAGSLTALAVDGGYVLDGTAPPVLSGADADVLVLAATIAGPGRLRDAGSGAAPASGSGAPPDPASGGGTAAASASGAGAVAASASDAGAVAAPASGAGAAPASAADAGAAPGGTLWVVVDAAGLAVRPHESADPTRATAEVRARGLREIGRAHV